MRLITLRNRNSSFAQDRKRCRSRYRKTAVRAINPASSFHHGRGQNPRFAQQFQRNASADNIHNGIDSADFMEMNFLSRKAVDFSLRHSDAMENSDGFGFDPVRK